MSFSFLKHSYLLLAITGLLLPGLGHCYLNLWKKGLFFFLCLSFLFLFGWWLTGFESLNQALPHFNLPLFPGLLYFGLAALVEPLQPSSIGDYNPSTYELGQICLTMVTLINVMVFFEALEQLFWIKKRLAGQPYPKTPSFPEESLFQYRLKKVLLLINFGLWSSLFFWTQNNLKLLCCFPLCFLISCLYQACRFEDFSRIFWEAERMYLKLSYSLGFFYFFLIII